MNKGFKTRIRLKIYSDDVVLFALQYTKGLLDIWWTAGEYIKESDALDQQKLLEKLARCYPVD